jgi:hypothetical protein
MLRERSTYKKKQLKTPFVDIFKIYDYNFKTNIPSDIKGVHQTKIIQKDIKKPLNRILLQ